MKGQTLADGRKPGRHGRLTDKALGQLQEYYGRTIRRNPQMCGFINFSRDVWDTWIHKLSTDSKPQHGLCPEDEATWCVFN